MVGLGYGHGRYYNPFMHVYQKREGGMWAKHNVMHITIIMLMHYSSVACDNDICRACGDLHWGATPSKKEEGATVLRYVWSWVKGSWREIERQTSMLQQWKPPMLQASEPHYAIPPCTLYGNWGGGVDHKGHPKQDRSAFIFIIYHNDIGVLFHIHR